MTLGCWPLRHPLLAYFGLTYLISWGGIALVHDVTDFDLVNLRPLDTGLIFVSMLLGPSVSGLAMTARLQGRARLRRLWSSLARWQVGARWYALALLMMPVLFLEVLCPLAAFLDPAFAPSFKWQLFAMGLVAGSFEEIGWTGFATPRPLAGQRLFMAGLSLGLWWALWHAVDLRQNFDAMGFAWLLEFAVFYPAALSAYRLLMGLGLFEHAQPVAGGADARQLYGLARRPVPHHVLRARPGLADRLCGRPVAGGGRGHVAVRARAEELGSLMKRCRRPTVLASPGNLVGC